MPSELTYKGFYNPYNDNLTRSDTIPSTISERYGNDIVQNPGDLGENTLDGQSIDNIEIASWIKSSNYRPKTHGFIIDGKTGYIEAMSLFVKGGITGGNLDIPDTTTANSFHVDSSGNMWSGLNTAGPITSAPAYILNTGASSFTNVLIAGRSGSTLAAAINSAGNLVRQVVNSKLNTSTQEILGEFTFASLGAIKMATDANNGVWISPTGLLGKKAGITTFAITTGGDATFGGELLAAYGTFGTITAGTLIGATIKTNVPVLPDMLPYAQMDSGGFTVAGLSNFEFKHIGTGATLGSFGPTNTPFHSKIELNASEPTTSLSLYGYEGLILNTTHNTDLSTNQFFTFQSLDIATGDVESLMTISFYNAGDTLLDISSGSVYTNYLYMRGDLTWDDGTNPTGTGIGFFTGGPGGWVLMARSSIGGDEHPVSGVYFGQENSNYTIEIKDIGRLIEMMSGSAITVTVLNNTSGDTYNFPEGSQIDFYQGGAGKVTFVADAGVTIKSKGGNLSLGGQYSGGTLIKTATNTWFLAGDLIA